MYEAPGQDSESTANAEQERLLAALHDKIANTPFGSGPHVWVGTVADYFAGQPHGHWINATQPLEQVKKDIAFMASRSPSDPNSPVHMFGQIGFGRHAPSANARLHEVVLRARQYAEDVRAYRAWANLGADGPGWLQRFPVAYQGRFDALHDWIVLEVERAGYDRLLDARLPDTIRPHVEINIESLEHELRTTGAVLTANDRESGGVFVFTTGLQEGNF